uniref:GIN domain-containing protein n=1 Tax=Flavobacterium sp. TaxID=239 RepID=UPI004049EDB1
MPLPDTFASKTVVQFTFISHIITEVENNTLMVRFEKNKSYTYTSTITITIPFEEISSVSFAGSGEIETKNTITA